jgi:hypothetical protein
MKPLATTCITCCVILLASSPLHAQLQRDGPLLSAGAYASLGITTSGQPTGSHGGVQGQIGIFADYARYALRPGIDARLAGQSFTFPSLILVGEDGNNGTATEKLIGPRLSYANGPFHPYVEALFGKGYESGITQTGVDKPYLYAQGTAKYGVAGLDLETAPHLDLRFEYSLGTIGSPQGFFIQNFTTGLVFHFP